MCHLPRPSPHSLAQLNTTQDRRPPRLQNENAMRLQMLFVNRVIVIPWMF